MLKRLGAVCCADHYTAVRLQALECGTGGAQRI
jgi:hypothetical protein